MYTTRNVPLSLSGNHRVVTLGSAFVFGLSFRMRLLFLALLRGEIGGHFMAFIVSVSREKWWWNSRYFSCHLFWPITRLMVQFPFACSCRQKNLCSTGTTAIECFHSRDQWAWFSTTTNESVCIRIEFNSRRISWDTNMAAVPLFRDTNMAAVTSRENTL